MDGKRKDAAALVYMHGVVYTVGSVDEFENGLRILVDESDVVVSNNQQTRRAMLTNPDDRRGIPSSP